LSNKHNKENFLDLLTTYLHQSGIHVPVVLAGDEGDASIVIVKYAVQMASSFDNMLRLVVTDDTDVLVLLLYHATGDCNLILHEG
jgi:hypothetical protein